MDGRRELRSLQQQITRSRTKKSFQHRWKVNYLESLVHNDKPPKRKYLSHLSRAQVLSKNAGSGKTSVTPGSSINEQKGLVHEDEPAENQEGVKCKPLLEDKTDFNGEQAVTESARRRTKRETSPVKGGGQMTRQKKKLQDERLIKNESKGLRNPKGKSTEVKAEQAAVHLQRSWQPRQTGILKKDETNSFKKQSSVASEDQSPQCKADEAKHPVNSRRRSLHQKSRMSTRNESQDLNPKLLEADVKEVRLRKKLKCALGTSQSCCQEMVERSKNSSHVVDQQPVADCSSSVKVKIKKEMSYLLRSDSQINTRSLSSKHSESGLKLAWKGDKLLPKRNLLKQRKRAESSDIAPAYSGQLKKESCSKRKNIVRDDSESEQELKERAELIDSSADSDSDDTLKSIMQLADKADVHENSSSCDSDGTELLKPESVPEQSSPGRGVLTATKSFAAPTIDTVNNSSEGNKLVGGKSAVGGSRNFRRLMKGAGMRHYSLKTAMFRRHMRLRKLSSSGKQRCWSEELKRHLAEKCRLAKKHFTQDGSDEDAIDADRSKELCIGLSEVKSEPLETQGKASKSIKLKDNSFSNKQQKSEETKILKNIVPSSHVEKEQGIGKRRKCELVTNPEDLESKELHVDSADRVAEENETEKMETNDINKVLKEGGSNQDERSGKTESSSVMFSLVPQTVCDAKLEINEKKMEETIRDSVDKTAEKDKELPISAVTTGDRKCFAELVKEMEISHVSKEGNGSRDVAGDSTYYETEDNYSEEVKDVDDESDSWDGVSDIDLPASETSEDLSSEEISPQTSSLFSAANTMFGMKKERKKCYAESEKMFELGQKVSKSPLEIVALRQMLKSRGFLGNARKRKLRNLTLSTKTFNSDFYARNTSFVDPNDLSESDTSFDDDTCSVQYEENSSNIEEMKKLCRPCSVVVTDLFKQLNLEVPEIWSQESTGSVTISIPESTVKEDTFEGSFLNFITHQDEKPSVSTNKHYKKSTYSSVWYKNHSARAAETNKKYSHSSCDNKKMNVFSDAAKAGYHHSATYKSSTASVVRNQRTIYRCKCCHYTSSDKDFIEEHIYIHLNLKVFKCNYCGNNFTSQGAAIIHHQTCHKYFEENIIKTVNIIESEHYYEVPQDSMKVGGNQTVGKCLESNFKPKPIGMASQMIRPCKNDAYNKQSQPAVACAVSPESQDKSSHTTIAANAPVIISVLVSGNAEVTTKSVDSSLVSTTIRSTDRFRCTYCPFSAQKKNAILQHVAAHHAEETYYTCNLCKHSVFRSKDVIIKHVSQCHPDGEVHCAQLPDYQDTEELKTVSMGDKGNIFEKFGNVIGGGPRTVQSNQDYTGLGVSDQSASVFYQSPKQGYDSTKGSALGVQQTQRTTCSSQAVEDSGRTDLNFNQSAESELKIVNVISLKSSSLPSRSLSLHTKDNEAISKLQANLEVPVLLSSVPNIMGPNIPPVPEQNPDAPGPNEPPFIYCCKKCGFRAQFLTRIHEHIRKAHRVVCVYSCPYCNDYKGEKERDAYAHIVTRHPERDPDVPVCLCLEPRYISKFIASIGTAGQNRRGKVVTKMTSYNCRYCPLEFTEAVSLLLHITKLHDKTIVYLCPFCKEFTSPITFLMKEHLRVHHNKDASKESVYAYLTEKDAPEETQPFVPLSLASNATTKRCLQQPLNADVSHQDDVIIVNTSKASTLNKGTQSSHPTIMRQMLFQPPRPILPKMALHRVSSLSKTSPQVSASQPQPVLLIPASNLKSLALNKSNVDRQSTKEDTCSPPFQSKLADSTGTQELLMDCETVEEDQMNQSVVVEEEDVVITDVCKAVPISTAVTSRKMYAISSPGQTGHQNKSVFQAPSSLGNSNQQTAPTIYLSSNENIKRGSNLVHIHDPTSFSAGATKDTIYIPGDMSKAPSPVLRVPSLGRPRRPYSVLSANANQIWKTPSKDTLLNRLIQAAPPPNVCVTAAGQISDTTLSSNFHQKKKSYTVVPGSPLDLSPAKSKMMLNLSDSISDASIHRPPPDVEEISPDAFKVFNLSPGEASEPPRPSSAIYIPPSNSSYPSMVGSYPAPPIAAIARPPQPVGPPVQNTHIQQLLLKNSPHSFVVPKSRVDKTDLKVLKCEKCDFKTYYRAALKTHETFKHSQIYRCPYCPDVFPMDSFEVEPHIRSTHPGKKIAFMRIG